MVSEYGILHQPRIISGADAIGVYLGGENNPFSGATVRKLHREEMMPGMYIKRRLTTDTYLLSIWIWNKYLEHLEDLESRTGLSPVERKVKRKRANEVSLQRMLGRLGRSEHTRGSGYVSKPTNKG